jgi:hypothetical protein
MKRTHAVIAFVLSILWIHLLAWLGFNGATFWQIAGGIAVHYLAVALYIGRAYPERETNLHDDLRKHGP